MSPEETLEQMESQTSESCRDDLKIVMASLLAIGAEDIREPQGWSRYSEWSAAVVEGPTHRPIEGRESGDLVVGPEGLSWVLDEDRRRDGALARGRCLRRLGQRSPHGGWTDWS